jgi:hypothetical protein
MTKIGLMFVGTCILCGKFAVLITAVSWVKFLMGFADVEQSGSGAYDKLKQFTHFIKNCFIAPNIEIGQIESLPAFRLSMPNAISSIGIILTALAVIGFFLNFKSQLIIKASGLWVLLASVLLYVIGWGSPENGMVLYTLYFGWAFFVLVFMLVDKVIGKFKLAKLIVFILSFLTLLAINIPGIASLVQFGIEYYPN